jgi:hypothetical protein
MLLAVARCIGRNDYPNTVYEKSGRIRYDVKISMQKLLKMRSDI